VALVYVIVEFGLVFQQYLSLTDAVRDGARTAAVSRTDPDPGAAACSAVQAAAPDLNLVCGTDIKVSPSSGLQAGSDVTVSASHPYSLSFFGVTLASGSLQSSTTERVE
jgi:Flp pilus assembly protein TadG